MLALPPILVPSARCPHHSITPAPAPSFSRPLDYFSVSPYLICVVISRFPIYCMLSSLLFLSARLPLSPVTRTCIVSHICTYTRYIASHIRPLDLDGHPSPPEYRTAALLYSSCFILFWHVSFSPSRIFSDFILLPSVCFDLSLSISIALVYLLQVWILPSSIFFYLCPFLLLFSLSRFISLPLSVSSCFHRANTMFGVLVDSYDLRDEPDRVEAEVPYILYVHLNTPGGFARPFSW